MESITRLDQLAHYADGPRSKDGLLEFRHRIAPPNLAKVPALLPRRAIGQLTRERSEAIRVLQYFRRFRSQKSTSILSFSV